MTSGWLRAIAGALTALVIVGIGELTYFLALCPQHQAWVRTTTHRSEVVRDDGYSAARPGDAIYVCTTLHCAGPLCHDDRACDCAPSAIDASALGRLLGGECVLDKAQPARSDDFGACRYARCDTHIH